MIISRTPFRISLAGGGSDVKEFYEQEPGAVLSITIDKYMYLSMHPMFNSGSYHLKYFDNEMVGTLEEIKHPIIREVFRRFDILGVDFNSSSDVPSGTGLGSSSSFTVGLINICTRGLLKEYVASLACNIEIDILKAPIGKQDQYAAAYGGMNFMQFNSDETVDITAVQKEGLEERLMLYYVGNPRKTETVLELQKKSIEKNRLILRKLVKLAQSLQDESCDNFGKILHEGWMYKKELACNVTNEVIDYWYDVALRNGAEGGKLLGAGQGGFLLLYTKDRDRLKKAMTLYELPFRFDYTGSKIIYDGYTRNGII